METKEGPARSGRKQLSFNRGQGLKDKQEPTSQSAMVALLLVLFAIAALVLFFFLRMAPEA
jgi:hypothetical protein